MDSYVSNFQIFVPALKKIELNKSLGIYVSDTRFKAYVYIQHHTACWFIPFLYPSLKAHSRLVSVPYLADFPDWDL